MYLQPLGEPVVLPEEYGVHGGQPGLLADPRVAAVEAEARVRLALLVLGRHREEVLPAAVRRERAVQAAVDVLAELVGVAHVVAVHHGRVDESSVLIHLLPWSCQLRKWTSSHDRRWRYRVRRQLSDLGFVHSLLRCSSGQEEMEM